ncbi:hypothetical protein [Shinella sumterensis]|uniref:hypothetical protein n=1 Tax=Shinella sumterensis TaxID=1967501 RepID=UPI003F87B5BC
MSLSTDHLENAARIAFGPSPEPLPARPADGPFGYFRLSLVVLAAMVAVVALFSTFG